MKKPLLPISLACAVVMSGCVSVTYNDSSTAFKEVEALERARFKAQVAVDTSTLRPMLAEDLLYCHSSGVCQNKEEFIGFVGSGTNKYLAMDVVSLKPRLLGDSVLINGKMSVRVETDGKVDEFQGVYTDVYTKRNGQWQLVSWQSTRVR